MRTFFYCQEKNGVKNWVELGFALRLQEQTTRIFHNQKVFYVREYLEMFRKEEECFKEIFVYIVNEI